MIRIYNRFTCGDGDFVRAGMPPPPGRSPPPKCEPKGKEQKGFLAGIMDAVSSFLPSGMDIGDVLLLLILLFLFLESKDEDFLIILVVTAFFIFKKE